MGVIGWEAGGGVGIRDTGGWRMNARRWGAGNREWQGRGGGERRCQDGLGGRKGLDWGCGGL